MSCISKILEEKGNKDFIVSGQIAIEGGGVYRDYEYLITFVSHGHRCGYVAISENHPLHSFKHSKYDFPDLEVHGGVTFFDEPRFEEFMGGHKCTDKWIGFDAAHCDDLSNMETVEKYFGEIECVKYRKINIETSFEDESEHRTYSYMEDQCKLLIDQLIEMNEKDNK